MAQPLNIRVTPQSCFNSFAVPLRDYLRDGHADAALHACQIQGTLRAAERLNDPQRPDTALVLPTGAGKTGIAVLAPYVCNAARVLVITPSTVISSQVDQAFQEFLVGRGLINQQIQHLVCPPRGLVDNANGRTVSATLTHPLMVVNAHKIQGNGKTRVKITDMPQTYDLVIVDEAHHYPADTWKQLVDHFHRAKKLFLTATAEHKGGPILDNQAACIAFEMKHQDAVQAGIIRPLVFEDSKSACGCCCGRQQHDDSCAPRHIAARVKHHVAQHDQEDEDVFHQAMVLCQTTNDLHAAEAFVRVYNTAGLEEKEQCKLYVSGSARQTLDDFVAGRFRTLVIVGRLTEGFDHKNVSVVAINRNVRSRVLFAQFVGRAVRRLSPNDPITGVVVSHALHAQHANFERFDHLAEEEQDEPEDD